jgi:hypothetical protein
MFKRFNKKHQIYGKLYDINKNSEVILLYLIGCQLRLVEILGENSGTGTVFKDKGLIYLTDSIKKDVTEIQYSTSGKYNKHTNQTTHTPTQQRRNTTNFSLQPEKAPFGQNLGQKQLAISDWRRRTQL